MNINHKNLTTEELLHNYEEISNLFYLPYVPMPERENFTLSERIFQKNFFLDWKKNIVEFL